MGDLFPVEGEPCSVVQSLCMRIGIHSPELVMQIQQHLERNGEALDERTTFDGTDASAKLFFALLEAMIAYEQLRLELMTQTRADTPTRIFMAMSIGTKIEPGLLALTKEAFSLHLHLWNAHSVAARLSGKKK